MDHPAGPHPHRRADGPTAANRRTASPDRSTAAFRADSRGDVPMRIAPLLLVGLILVVLAIMGSALL